MELFKPPKYTYTVELTKRTYWNVEAPPNWFHRLMQRLFFGIKWRKIK